MEGIRDGTGGGGGGGGGANSSTAHLIGLVWPEVSSGSPAAAATALFFSFCCPSPPPASGSTTTSLMKPVCGAESLITSTLPTLQHHRQRHQYLAERRRNHEERQCLSVHHLASAAKPTGSCPGSVAGSSTNIFSEKHPATRYESAANEKRAVQMLRLMAEWRVLAGVASRIAALVGRQLDLLVDPQHGVRVLLRTVRVCWQWKRQ